MATEIELALGEHTVKWSNAGYDDLIAKINVMDTGVSCVSVDVPGGACGSTTPPGVVVSDFTVTGYLKKTADICSWIDESGVTNLTLDHALYVYYLSRGWTSLADKKYAGLSPKPSELDTTLATLDNALGVFYYSQGWTSLGNKKTGCSY